MTTPYQPLSRQSHGHLYWHGPRDYHFAEQRTLLPLVAGELTRALGQLPLVFTREPDGPRLMALLGTRPGNSLLVSPDGQWQADYLPAYLRAHPFALLSQGPGRYTVGIDVYCELVSDNPTHGSPLFTAAGEPAEGTQQVVKFLRQLAQQRASTDAAVRALDEAGLLEPWALALPDEQEGSLPIDGLYRVTDAGLKALGDATLGELARRGALAVAYAQLFGQHQVARLIRLQQDAARQAKGDSAGNIPDDISALFDSDDEIKFGFD